MKTMKHGILVLVLLALMLSPAWAQEDKADYSPIVVDRPQTLAAGMGEARLDFGLGLNSGRTAKDMNLGLGFGYGLLSNLELGVDIDALHYAKDATGTNFGGASIYTIWEFWKFLALYGDVHFPGNGDFLDSFGDQLFGLTLGVTAKYTIIEHILATYGGLFVDLGFAKEDFAGAMPQFNLALAYGLTANAMQALWFDLNIKAIMELRPSVGGFGDRLALPLTLTVGTTPIDPLDIYLAFEMSNLNPPTGGAIDNRVLWLGAAFRF